MEWENLVPLITLIALEVVLGIDNIVFIAILAAKLPPGKQEKARRLGLILAAVLRIALLSLITYILGFEENLFTVFNEGISVKDLILLGGGTFLLYKSTKEIFHKMEGVRGDQTKKISGSSFMEVVSMIIVMDAIFSLDSIITAIGVVKEVWIMYVAVIISVGMMLVAAGPIGRFINKHPAFKMLALCFLLLIGFTLVSEGLGVDIPKGYVYFSMAFAFLVNIFQMRMNKASTQAPVDTHEHYSEEEEKKLPKDILK
jgi:predicted tellurium resistance membrane protein TerC